MEFKGFPKIPRLNRSMVVTEKIDGTNASIHITDAGEFLVGSRNKFITPDNDNYGFAKWAYAHKDELLTLGVGSHYGEWWGQGIQRGYGLAEKRFSLFNTSRWIENGNPLISAKKVLPPCCKLVPVLYTGLFDNSSISELLSFLAEQGSIAAPGFMKPEGVVIYHMAANAYFKVTIEKDAESKGNING